MPGRKRARHPKQVFRSPASSYPPPCTCPFSIAAAQSRSNPIASSAGDLFAQYPFLFPFPYAVFAPALIFVTVRAPSRLTPHQLFIRASLLLSVMRVFSETSVDGWLWHQTGLRLSGRSARQGQGEKASIADCSGSFSARTGTCLFEDAGCKIDERR
jgi:hypothetical protein